jgi:hypothetical protein
MGQLVLVSSYGSAGLKLWVNLYSLASQPVVLQLELVQVVGQQARRQGPLDPRGAHADGQQSAGKRAAHGAAEQLLRGGGREGRDVAVQVEFESKV